MINIPSSIEIFSEGNSLKWTSLTLIAFHAHSNLSRFEKAEFCGSGLRSLDISASVEVAHRLDHRNFSLALGLDSIIRGGHM
jgi:hypothetical protein